MNKEWQGVNREMGQVPIAIHGGTDHIESVSDVERFVAQVGVKTRELYERIYALENTIRHYEADIAAIRRVFGTEGATT